MWTRTLSFHSFAFLAGISSAIRAFPQKRFFANGLAIGSGRAVIRCQRTWSSAHFVSSGKNFSIALPMEPAFRASDLSCLWIFGSVATMNRTRLYFCRGILILIAKTDCDCKLNLAFPILCGMLESIKLFPQQDDKGYRRKSRTAKLFRRMKHKRERMAARLNPETPANYNRYCGWEL